MLSIIGSGFGRNCEGATRRELLRIGALGVGGLSLPGLLAARANASGSGFVNDKAIVRSFRHRVASHAPASELVAAGGNPTKATMGTVYSRVAGGSNRTTGIPNNVVRTPPAAGGKDKELGAQTERVTGISSLPSAYKAFDPSSVPSEIARTLTSNRPIPPLIG